MPLYYIMDVDTSPHTKMIQFIQNPEILQLRQQIMDTLKKKKKVKFKKPQYYEQ